MYRFPTESLGEGQTVGLIELTLDDPKFARGYFPEDVNLYFELVGITPPPLIEDVSVDGARNTPGNFDNDLEVCLDIEIAGSIVPRARILVFFAPDSYQGFYDGMETMLHDYRVDVASMSFGFLEVNVPPAISRAFDELFASVADHSTVIGSSGDNGSTNELGFSFVDAPPAPYIPPPGTANVIFPSNCPHCLCVGGTALIANGEHTERICEVVWNNQDGISATGGGVSDVFEVPDYQRRNGIVERSANQHKTGRAMPDVAANADGNRGYKVRVDGFNILVFGTSCSTPLWAGLVARMNAIAGRNFGFLNPLLYDHPSGLHDIRRGDNGQYSARCGYDLCTGLGVPSERLLPTLLRAISGSPRCLDRTRRHRRQRSSRRKDDGNPAPTTRRYPTEPVAAIASLRSQTPTVAPAVGRRVIEDSNHRPLPGSVRDRALTAAELAAERVAVTVIFKPTPSKDLLPSDETGLAALCARYGFVDEGRRGPWGRRLVGRADRAVEAFGLDGFSWWRQAAVEDRYRAHDGRISLPATESWTSRVAFVAGLDTHRLPRRRPPELPPRTPKDAARVVAPEEDGVGNGECPVQIGPWFPNGYFVNDLVKLYGFPAEGFGEGQTIGLVELLGGFQASDLATYWTLVGIATPPEVTVVGVDGGTNNFTGASHDLYPTSSIECAGNVAQRSKIVVFFAPDTLDGLFDAVATALHEHGVNVVSTSFYGAAEIFWPPALARAFDHMVAAAGDFATVISCSGYQGSSDGVFDGRAHVDFPASSPHVLGVGMTTLLTSGNHAFAKRLCEVAFNFGNPDVNGTAEATGGGVSDLFPVPAYQADHGIAPRSVNDGHLGRGVPDVALSNDQQYWINVWFLGFGANVGDALGNMSIWAGLIARLNNLAGRSLGFVNPLLYNNARAFHDITRGDNGAYFAHRGWDACTGLGVPSCRIARIVRQPSDRTHSTPRHRHRRRSRASKGHGK